jgi:tape measure domain-containing protein
MRFDNKHFENNVSNTMSTLDKLKQKLNLSGASKGLADVDAAAKNVNMSGLGNAVETVSAKFSALQVMGVTALANITNSAVNAGKRIVSALTIDPIKTGFSEYETKINSIQTIMSNTASKGTTMADVTRVIDELNTYADKTIYNFAEMTRNIGTFTAAGVGLEESASAIQGIANLAAASGSTSQQASTAMYQLSQALAAGTVKLMDWNSVVNAGMGGEKFQEALKATARDHGVAVDAMIKKNGSFRESLSEGWITAEILNETLNKFTVDGAKAYAQSMMEAGKWTKEQADALIEEAENMEDAATKVKTFTQLWDTLKESVQSGWGKTWELIVGDFEDARESLTKISDILTGPDSFLTKSADARNNFLEGLLGSNWDKLMKRLGDAGVEADKFEDSLRRTLEESGYDVEKLVDECDSLENIFKSGKVDADLLGKAIENLSRKAVDLSKVDRILWWGHAGEDVKQVQEALDALGYDLGSKGIDGIIGKETQDAIRQFQADKGLKVDGLVGDETLKALKEAAALTEEVDENSKLLVKDFEDLFSVINQKSGREMILESLANVLQALFNILGNVSEAFWDVFSLNPDKILDFISGIHGFTESLVEASEKTGWLKQTFKGLFAIIDALATIVGRALKIAFKVLAKILGSVDLDVSGLTTSIGDAAIKFRDWVDSIVDVEGAVDAIIPWLKKAYDWVKGLIDKIAETDAFDGFTSVLSDSGKAIKDWFDEIKRGDKTPAEVVEGLIAGLKNGSQPVLDAAKELGKKIIEGLKESLGIKAVYAEEAEKVGENVAAGAEEGLTSKFGGLFSKIKPVLKGFGEKLGGFFENLDFGSLMAAGFGLGILSMVKKVSDSVNALAGPKTISFMIGGVSEFLGGAGEVMRRSAEPIAETILSTSKVLKSFSKLTKSKAFNIRTEGIKQLAISIAILVGSIALLSFLDTTKVWHAVGQVAALAGILVALTVATSLLSKSSLSISKEGANVDSLALNIVGIAASLLIVAYAAKMLGGMDPNEVKQGLLSLAAIVGGLVGVMAVLKLLNKGDALGVANNVGSMLLKMAIAMAILVGLSKIMAGMDDYAMLQAAKGFAGLIVVVGLMTAITRLAGKHVRKVGSMLIQVGVAMAILVAVAKVAAGMTDDEFTQAAKGLAGMIAVVALLTAITRLAGNDLDKVGSTLMGIAGAMLILTIISIILSKMDPAEFLKGVRLVAALGLVVTGLIAATNLAAKDGPKLAGTLLAMSIAIAILAGIAVLFGMIDTTNLAKGIIAVGLLGSVMALMIWATRGASECKGNIYAMSVAIGVMAIAMAALSMIDASKLAGAVAALTVVMLAFSLLVLVAGKAQGAIGPLIVMTVAIGVLAAALYLLAGIPVKSALGVAAALSILMIALSVSLLIMSSMGPMSLLGLVGALGMAAVVAILGAVLKSLVEVPMDQALGITQVLITLMLSMSAALVVMSLVGLLGPAALIGIASMVAMIVAVGALVAGIGYLAGQIDGLEGFIDTGIPIIEKIGTAIGSFFGNLVGSFAEGALGGLTAIGDELSSFINSVSPFIAGVSSVPESALTGATNLVAMILMLTAANLINSVASFITGGSSMADLGAQLIPFGEAMAAFSDVVKGVDTGAVEAAANAGMIMTELQKSVYGSGGVVQWFLGEKDLGAFGEQLVEYGKAIIAFSDTVSSGEINQDAIQAAATAGSIMTELQKSLEPMGGVADWFLGSKDLGAFGEQLIKYGQAVIDFSNTVSSGEINQDAIEAAATAGSIMSNLQNNLEPMGGVADWFLGGKDLSTFGQQLISYGQSIVDFSNTVAGKIDPLAIQAAKDAGSIMASLQGDVGSSGGIIEWFTGKSDLATFGTNLVSFGTSLVDFSNAVAGGINSGAVYGASISAEYLADAVNAASDADTSGVSSFSSAISTLNGIDISGFCDTYSGTSQLVTIGSRISSFGTYLTAYANKVAGGDFSNVSSSVSAGQSIVSLIKHMADLDTSGISIFASGVNELANVSLDGFVSAFSGATAQLESTGGNLITSMVNGARAKLSAVKSSMSEIAQGAVTEIRNKLSEFRTTGGELANEMSGGFDDKQSDVRSSGASLAQSGVSGVRGKYGAMYGAATYCVSGLVNGLNAGQSRVRTAAQGLAEALKEGITLTLIIKSPSRLMREYGEYAGEGFIMGLNEYGSVAYEAGANMGDSAVDGLSRTIDTLGSLVSGDMDMTPTVRPVLDLSSVQNGVDQINGMFGNRTLALAGVNAQLSDMRLTSLDAAMDKMQSINETGNAELISAIANLRSDFGSLVDAIGGLHIRLDGNTVVGELVGRIDSSLGQITMHKGRRN